MNDHGPNQWK